MIDFELSEEQKALIDTAKRFAKERIIPVAAECDRESKFPMDVFEAAWEIGLVNPTLPAEYGGPGLGELENAIDHRGARVRLHRHPDEHDRQHARRSRRSSSPAPTSRRRSTSACSRASRSWRATRRPSRTPAATWPGMQCRASKQRRRRLRAQRQKAGSRTRTSRASTSSSRPRTRELRHKGIAAFIVDRDAPGPHASASTRTSSGSARATPRR